MSMTPMERTFLKGGRGGTKSPMGTPIKANTEPSRIQRLAMSNPVAKPIKANTEPSRIQRLAMSNPPSKGTIWQGPPSTNERLSRDASKWLSKDPTTKSGFAKDRAVARSIAGGGGKPFSFKGLPSPDIKDLAKGYFNFRKMLAPWEMLAYPGTAMAPSWQEMGFEMPPTIWHNEGPTGRYRRQDGN